MHELALADAIVAIAQEHADGRNVARVELEVGHLRQVVPRALTFAFQLVAEGTPVEGAQLVIEEIPARIACRVCGAETGAERFAFTCARCGASDVEVTAGEEFRVVALELQDAPVAAARR